MTLADISLSIDPAGGGLCGGGGGVVVCAGVVGWLGGFYLFLQDWGLGLVGCLCRIKQGLECFCAYWEKNGRDYDQLIITFNF